MENISEVTKNEFIKKKTKRNRRSQGKTKRNYKKKNNLNTIPTQEVEEEKKEDEKGGFLENLFSWF